MADSALDRSGGSCPPLGRLTEGEPEPNLLPCGAEARVGLGECDRGGTCSEEDLGRELMA